VGAPLARNRRLLRVRPLRRRHRRNHRRRVRAETPTERAPLPPVPGAERKEFSRAPSDSWRPASLVRSQSGLAHRWPICWLAGRPARVARSEPPARPAGNLGRATVWRLALEAQRAHLGRRCGPPGLCKPSRRRRRLSQSGSLWAEERRGDACAWRAHDAFNYGPIVFPCWRSRGSNQDQVSRAASCSPAHLSAGGRVGCDRSQWPPQLAPSASVHSGGRRGAS